MTKQSCTDEAPESAVMLGHSTFDTQPSTCRRQATAAFTVIELLVVITIIIILASLVLGTVGYVQKKGARSRAEAEIAAISAALENYKADNGIYPGNTDTNGLAPNTSGDPTSNTYSRASLYLYEELSGDHDNNRLVDSADDLTGGGVIPKTYFTFKPNNLSPATPPGGNVTGIRDSFGNYFGYSTARSSAPVGPNGYNPTFDLWSTAGVIDKTGSPNQSQWIKNW